MMLMVTMIMLMVVMLTVVISDVRKKRDEPGDNIPDIPESGKRHYKEYIITKYDDTI